MRATSGRSRQRSSSTRRVGRGLLLKLVEQLEQEARAGVIGHLELRELGAGNPRLAMAGKWTTQFDRLGDQALAAAAIARARGWPRGSGPSAEARGGSAAAEVIACGVCDLVEP